MKFVWPLNSAYVVCGCQESGPLDKASSVCCSFTGTFL